VLRWRVPTNCPLGTSWRVRDTFARLDVVTAARNLALEVRDCSGTELDHGWAGLEGDFWVFATMSAEPVYRERL